MTSSQDSLAHAGTSHRPSMASNNSETSMTQPTRSEQQKKKGIKSSLGKFFSSKKTPKSKDSLSSGKYDLNLM